MTDEFDALLAELRQIDAPRATAMVEIDEEAALDTAIKERDPEALRELIAARSKRARDARIYLPIVIVLSVIAIVLGVWVMYMLYHLR